MNYHTAPTRPKARKEHRCIFCGGPILVGERYMQQTGFYEGQPYRNRYHSECYETLLEEEPSGDWVFSPYSGDCPARVQATVDARRKENLK
jgi:hypothetical protein